MRCLTGGDTNVCLNNILISAGAWPGFLVGGGGGGGGSKNLGVARVQPKHILELQSMVRKIIQYKSCALLCLSSDITAGKYFIIMYNNSINNQTNKSSE